MAYMLQKVSRYFRSVCVVTNSENQHRIQKITNLGWFSSVSVVTDMVPSCGPLAGIYTGLFSIPSENAFFLAADQPFISLPLIRYMFTKIEHCDAVVPRSEKGYEPLFCIYTKQCAETIKTMIDSEMYQVSKLFDKIKTTVIPIHEIKRYDPGLQSFINVNTETDYRLLNPKFIP